MSKKSTKKVSKKVVKKAKKNKFFGFIIFVLIVAALVLGGMSYVKLNKISKSFDDIDTKFETIPAKTDAPIDFFDAGDGFVWTYDKNYFPNDGEINRPLYSEGNKKTTITLKYEGNLNPIDKIVDNLLKTGISTKTWTKDVTILALLPTDNDKVNDYYEVINLPNTIYNSMTLRTSSASVDGLTISWSSNNHSVILDDGTVVGVGSAKLTATITLGDITKTKEFNVEVKDTSDIVVYDCDFTDYSDSSYVNSDNYLGLTLNGCKSADGVVVTRSKSDGTEQGVIITKEIKNAKSISFGYSYLDTTKNYTKNSFVELFYSSDNEIFVSLKKETLSDALKHDFEYNIDNLSGYFKIVVSTEYSESLITIDDLKIERFFNSDDVSSALIKELPTKISSSYDFPLTTPYGGSVSYSSSDQATLTNLGALATVDSAKDITLHITVTGFSFPVSFDYTLKVTGPSSVEPVEVRFIDLNKNGGNSDCGESTYIRIGNIDVLIDAGDNYNQTFENVKECINTYSLDKELDYVIATHPDSDHIGSMDSVINEFKVLHLITFVENDGDTTGVFNAYKEAYMAESGCEVCYVIDSYNNVGTCKRHIELAPDVYIDIINTTFYDLDSNAANDNNGRSVVCVFSAYGTRILFTGDAENLGRDIESATKDEIGNIDILKVVHHGTKNGCSEEYLKAIDPEVAIICNGNYLGNKHGHPTFEAISSLYKYDGSMKVYTITGGKGGAEGSCEKGSSYVCEGNKDNYNFERNGMITIVIDDNGYTISSENYGDSPIEIKDTNFYKEMSNVYN